MWSLTYVVNVQSVSLQYMNCNLINWYTRTTNSFAVVCAVKTLNVNAVLYYTFGNVPISWDLAIIDVLHVFAVVPLRRHHVMYRVVRCNQHILAPVAEVYIDWTVFTTRQSSKKHVYFLEFRMNPVVAVLTLIVNSSSSPQTFILCQL